MDILKSFGKTVLKFLILSVFTSLIFLIILSPEICKNGAFKGILLSGRVIIPSLFPFSVCSVFIMKSINIKTVKTKKLLIFLFSSIGGYPIGAKLLNEAVKEKSISAKSGGKMLNFCLNAGPAFIIAAVGSGILGSKKLGYILFISHLLSSFIISVFLREKNTSKSKTKLNSQKKENVIDNFIISVYDAANVCLNICSFVILFSVIGSYFDYFSKNSAFLKTISYFLEVTTAVSKTQNIYIISFLLGFAGICVWCQVLSAGKDLKINFFLFILCRIIHGFLSVIITKIIISVFNISLDCLTNSVKFSIEDFYSTPVLSLSLLIMALIFLISVFSKNDTGNILEDMV